MRTSLRRSFALRVLWLAALLPLGLQAADTVEQLTVSGWRDARGIAALPSELVLDGPFGDSRSLKDTPRAATGLTPELMTRFGVVDMHDLTRVAPNL